MDAKTLVALKRSIEKWEKIVAGTGTDRGSENCVLCETFLCGPNQSCSGCPVDDLTNGNGCDMTPYEKWWFHTRNHETKHGPDGLRFLMVECEECKRLAQAELDFLKSLLPEEK